ncbi:hypothetical protein [Hymenobacter cellulosivorans]|uniref:Uncharacterized protein n=1 Tax=Hymenobacter cellulosivorans TaxID=2932249 RepID=A0ABY4F8P2_9BACT|nr:hypothetical protein [Hymenobacter cellulosivorans]UOQ53034.1 hypothetical protein MUN80_25270 [Hymenobacter cellulosivorans]
MRYFLFLALALASCVASRHAEPSDLLSMLAPSMQGGVAPDALPDSLPKQDPLSAPDDKPGFFKRAATRVGAAFSSSGKIKNSTINIQLGNGNTAATATKPGTMATGSGASATDATKAEAPVQVGQQNQATDNTKAGQRGGAAATGEGSTVTAPASSTWWKWLLGGVVLGYLGPKLLKLGGRFV